MTEAQHQMQIFKWSVQSSVRAIYPELKLLYHIPNGGKRDPIEARHLKAQGVKKGVPDLHLPVARGNYHGLYIELKTEKGKATPEQKWWLNELSAQGYFCSICKGYQEAIKCLESYLLMK